MEFKSNMKNKTFTGLHGDVVISRVEGLPNGLKAVKRRVVGVSPVADFILAEGEVTGHAHRIHCEDGAMELYEDSKGTLYMKVMKNVTVTHEEHKPRVIPPGDYVCGFQQQFNYLSRAKERVMD